MTVGEQYSFYRVPKVLFTAECFKFLSCEAKGDCVGKPCGFTGADPVRRTCINVNIKMYIFDHLRMYIFAILPLDRYIFLSDKIFL